jgi:antitoxin (DNA-binding transcriptional repressor) of toxin-antitoxin stability system
MLKALTVSEAKPKLGRLLDRAGEGHAVYLRRNQRLFRIEPVAEIEPIPSRPFGFFAVEENDPMVALANSAPASFAPLP